jgi:hypothetical protein
MHRMMEGMVLNWILGLIILILIAILLVKVIRKL